MDRDFINNITKSAAEATKHLDAALAGVNSQMQTVLENVPDEHKQRAEGIRILVQKTMALAKKGDVNGINKLIKDYENGSKGN